MKKLKIFCDFDGTVTKNDVWVNSLGRFIKDKNKFEIICNEFASLLLTARQCIAEELRLVENFNFSEFNGYLETEKLDDYFKEFSEYCNSKEYDIILVSEGLDYYINYILEKESLKLPFYSNKLVLNEYNISGEKEIRLTCEFPYSDEDCSWCGMSKRNILLNNTNEFEGEISVFIGDGISDCCVVHYADIVFAKKTLASYCWKNNITYFEYRNFNDVKNKLIKLESQNKLSQRQTARIKRKDVFLGG